MKIFYLQITILPLMLYNGLAMKNFKECILKDWKKYLFTTIIASKSIASI